MMEWRTACCCGCACEGWCSHRVAVMQRRHDGMTYASVRDSLIRHVIRGQKMTWHGIK
jgi:hypothetical protein